MRLIILLLHVCCALFSTAQTAPAKRYSTLGYLTINPKLPSNPYIKEFTKGIKKIVFCGVEHVDPTDTMNEMYAAIERKFNEVKPNVALNEGGNMDGKKFASRNQAILKDGEIGLIKLLADSQQIPCINADMNEAEEFAGLLTQFSTAELIAFISTERLMWGLRGRGVISEKDIEAAYIPFVKSYIEGLGKISLTKEQESFAYFKKAYRKLVGRTFTLSTIPSTDPFKKSRISLMSRVSKQTRDQHLMATIEQLLTKHDRLFIVFGGWHLLTCEPALEKMIELQ